MKPNMISDILDLARNVRSLGEKFNPLFEGPPGIGKSEIIQAWCKKQGIPFMDLRAAYLEAPDVIGFPEVRTVTDSAGVERTVTAHNIPEFWPHTGEGVLFLDEINRGNTSILNCFMQVLTDRKIHKYELPDGWIIVGAVNPEAGGHDVTQMDPALKNRFAIFDVDYDKRSFLEFMKSQNWNPIVISFIESGAWSYLRPEEVGDAPGNKYLSPRSFSYLNAVMQASKMNMETESVVVESILGKNVAKAFLQFKNNEAPVMMEDLLSNKAFSLKQLKRYSDPNAYKNGHISVTIKSIVDTNTITNDLLAEVVTSIPADQAVHLVRELCAKRKMNNEELLRELINNYPSVKKYLKTYLAK